jgi:hypothetical protein
LNLQQLLTQQRQLNLQQMLTVQSRLKREKQSFPEQLSTLDNQ